MTLEQRGPFAVLSAREIYRNPWIRLVEYAVRHASGDPGIFAVLERRDGLGVSIVAVTDDGRVCLVGQHRFGINQFSWETPRGAPAEGEAEVDAAARELQEETGLEARAWTRLGALRVMPDNYTGGAVVYLARDVSFGPSQPEPTEQISVRFVPLVDALRMAQEGEIVDAITVAGLFRAWHHLNPSGPVP